MKNSRSILAIVIVVLLLSARPFYGLGNNQPTGLAIWNAVFCIHNNDTLALYGDLHLLDANVQGSGTLALIADTLQNIFAHNSRLSNLLISNRDTVVLHGELQVENSLVINQGVFDARSGKLILSDTIFIWVHPSAQWLRTQADVWLALGFAFPPPSNNTPPPCTVICYTDNCLTRLLPPCFLMPPGPIDAMLLAGWARNPDPPPRGRQCSTQTSFCSCFIFDSIKIF